MVDNLNRQKVPHTLDILENVYGTSDIITLQEVSASFITQAENRALGDKYWIVAPNELDPVRDQNSVIFLSRETFPSGPKAEITSIVENSFETGVDVPIAKGDILAITATDRDNIRFVIASFHGGKELSATMQVQLRYLSLLFAFMTTCFLRHQWISDETGVECNLRSHDSKYRTCHSQTHFRTGCQHLRKC